MTERAIMRHLRRCLKRSISRLFPRRKGQDGRFRAYCWLLVLMSLPGPLAAQEVMHESVAGEQAAEARKGSVEGGDYNLKLGPVGMSVSAGLRGEYWSNADYSQQGQADWLFGPTVSLALEYRITEQQTLRTALSAEYLFSSRGNENRLGISPDSLISWDAYAGDWRLTLADHIGYSVDPGNSGAVSGTARFGGIDNKASADATWDLDEVLMDFGYAYQSFWSDVSEFSYLDRSTHLPSLRAVLAPNSTLSFGPEVTGMFTTYEQSILDPSMGWMAGAFVQAQLSDYVSGAVRGGYTGIAFDKRQVTLTQDVGTYYFKASINHRLNDIITHGVEVGREVPIGTYSNYEIQWQARYTMGLNFFEDTPLQFALLWENGEVPPYLSDRGNALIYYPGQKYTRYGGSVTLSHQLSSKISSSLSYEYLEKLASGASTGYDQHRVSVQLQYRF